jgi:hypothetical protein
MRQLFAPWLPPDFCKHFGNEWVSELSKLQTVI